MRNTTSVRLDARKVRDALLMRGGPNDAGFVRCAYRPFDNRWLYWEAESCLLARPRPGMPAAGVRREFVAVSRIALAHGRELVALLDPDAPIPGVTQGALRPEVAAIAVPVIVDRRNMAGEDFAVTAGWGNTARATL